MDDPLIEIEEAFDAAQDQLDEGDLAAARRSADEGLARLRGVTGEAADALRIEGWMLRAWIAFDAGEDDDVLPWLAQVRALAPADPGAAFLEALLHLHHWELDAAEALLAHCDPPRELRPDVHYYRGVIADLQRRFADADRLYRLAARLDPERYPQPVRISDDDAHAMLDRLVRSFPEDVRAVLENVRIDLLDVPDAVIDREAGTDPMLLGVYHGVPVDERSATPFAMPDTVRIFKRNIERVARDREDLEEQLRITLLHEVGHHLGWDEDEVAERGLE